MDQPLRMKELRIRGMRNVLKAPVGQS